jgi:putative DNA primase/helicase
MLPLPRPEGGGSINRLRKFVNLTDDGFVLFVAVLLYAFCPDKPHPVLYLSGEQGVAKSTATKIARLLVDPVAQKELTRKMPESVRDLYVAARNAYLLGLNNISKSRPMSAMRCVKLLPGRGTASERITQTVRNSLSAAGPH